MNTIFLNSENSKTSDTHRLYSNSQALEFECCFIKSDYLLCIEKYKKSHAKKNKS